MPRTALPRGQSWREVPRLSVCTFSILEFWVPVVVRLNFSPVFIYIYFLELFLFIIKTKPSPAEAQVSPGGASSVGWFRGLGRGDPATDSHPDARTREVTTLGVNKIHMDTCEPWSLPVASRPSGRCGCLGGKLGSAPRRPAGCWYGHLGGRARRGRGRGAAASWEWGRDAHRGIGVDPDCGGLRPAPDSAAASRQRVCSRLYAVPGRTRTLSAEPRSGRGRRAAAGAPSPAPRLQAAGQERASGPPELKSRGRGRRRTGVRAARPPRDPLTASGLEEDVAGVRGAPGLGSVSGGPGLRRERGRPLHAGPEPRAPDARVLLLRGSSGPGGLGAGPVPAREGPKRVRGAGGAGGGSSRGRGQRKVPPRGRGWRRARGAGRERVPPEGAGPEGGPPRGRGWRRARGTGPESVAPEGAGPEEGPPRGRGRRKAPQGGGAGEGPRGGAGESAPRGGGAGGRSQRGRAGGVGGVSKVSESDSTELRRQSTASPVPPRLLWKTWPGHPAYPGGGKSGRRRGSGGVSD